jgi:hypothetical protein
MTLDSIVLEAIADNGENTLHKYVWYLLWAQQALRQWDMEVPMDVKTVRVSMDSRREASIPSGTVSVMRVGVLEGGSIKPLLASQGSIHAGGISSPSKDFCRFFDGNGYFTVPSSGNYAEGRWHYDSSCGILRVTGTLQSVFYAELAVRKFGSDCDAIIPDQMAEMIKSYIRYMENRKNERVSARQGNSNTTQSLEMEYDRQKLIAFSRLNPIDIDSIRDASRMLAPGFEC